MHKTNLKDEELIFNFQNGDIKAYNELVYRYKDKILNFIYRFVGDLDLSQDLTQDTFLKFYIKKDSYKEIAKFSTWLYTIAANLAKTELRKIKRRKTYSFSQLSNENNEFDPGKAAFHKDIYEEDNVKEEYELVIKIPSMRS